MHVRLAETGGKPRARFVEREQRTPQPKAGIGEPPEHLNTAQRETWERIAADVPPGQLTRCDRDAFEAFVVLADLRDRCLREINAPGSSIVVHSQRDKRDQIAPVLRELKRIVSLLRALSGDLGLSPLARGRVQLVPPPSEPDALDRFLAP
jgi:P27 family predicted phage terminase small subunit